MTNRCVDSWCVSNYLSPQSPAIDLSAYFSGSLVEVFFVPLDGVGVQELYMRPACAVSGEVGSSPLLDDSVQVISYF